MTDEYALFNWFQIDIHFYRAWTVFKNMIEGKYGTLNHRCSLYEIHNFLIMQKRLINIWCIGSSYVYKPYNLPLKCIMLSIECENYTIQELDKLIKVRKLIRIFSTNIISDISEIPLDSYIPSESKLPGPFKIEVYESPGPSYNDYNL